MKILVIDDEPSIGRCVSLMLSPLNWTVDYAGTAESGVELVEKGEYDFVLLDYRMPGNDGIWFMKNARIPRRTKSLLMTAFINRGVINEMFKLGAVGYILKPFDEQELMKHLNFHSGALAVKQDGKVSS